MRPSHGLAEGMVTPEQEPAHDAVDERSFDPAFGSKLHKFFRRTGLGAPRLVLGAPPGGAADADILAYVAETWRSPAPIAERLVPVPNELTDPRTLSQRFRDEAAAADALLVMSPLICAWAEV